VSNPFLQSFEAALATAVDNALSNPTGGFFAFLQAHPSVAAVWMVGVAEVHNALSQYETPVTASAPISTSSSATAATSPSFVPAGQAQPVRPHFAQAPSSPAPANPVAPVNPATTAAQ
jgi:hypothetical protein